MGSNFRQERIEPTYFPFRARQPVHFATEEPGWFQSQHDEGDLAKSWKCDARVDSATGERPAVRYLAHASARLPGFDSAALVGDPGYLPVEAENPADAVRVRGYERRDSQFIVVKDTTLSEIQLERARDCKEGRRECRTR